MKKIYLDFETRSECDLKKEGLYKYATHPSTEIICVGYSLDRYAPQVLGPEQFINLLLDKVLRFEFPFEIIAHNAEFEYYILKYVASRFIVGYWKKVFFEKIKPEVFSCTSARAKALSLPPSLKDLALCLDLKEEKDEEGHSIIKRYCKPRPEWNKWNEGKGKTPDEPKKYLDEPDKINAIWDYCKQDVEVLMELDKVLPKLSPDEFETYIDSVEMNENGIHIDSELVNSCLKHLNFVRGNYLEKFRKLTGLNSPNQYAKYKMWLGEHSVDTEDLQKETVDTLLKRTDMNRDARLSLVLKKSLSKSSVNKFESIKTRLCEDQRIRNISTYHGARTGREAGRGVQIQNLPRGEFKIDDKAIKYIKEDDTGMLELIYGDVFGLLSSAIRSCFLPSEGKKLFVADFNAIECRVLFWLSGNKKGLEAFARGEDLYKDMASYIFKKSIETITPEERFIGKTAVLGCGYQMGHERFYLHCVKYGADWVSPTLAESAVNSFRELHKEVPHMWHCVEKAAMKAIKSKGKFHFNRISFYMEGGHLKVELPSGRAICYPFARIEKVVNDFGQLEDKICFKKQVGSGFVDSYTYGGELTENICQGTARDITVEAIKRVKEHDFIYLFQVHDEVASEGDKSRSYKEFEKIISIKPSWAEDLEIKAEAWEGYRYKK